MRSDPPNAPAARVLIAGSLPEPSEGLLGTLQECGYELVETATGAEAREALLESRFDALLQSIDLPDGVDIGLLAWCGQERPLLPVVVVTDRPKLDEALAAMRGGAFDYLTLPISADALQVAMERAIGQRRMRRELRRLRSLIAPGSAFPGVIGDSAAMRGLFALMKRVARTQSSVLISGESGTGKEVIAQALHQAGRTADGPFVAVNPAAIPETLLEAELFGHTRGAFTDASRSRKGLFLEAHGGTLFLDEIGEMPLGFQVKLLRALQERQVRPVGADKPLPFETRVVAATNRDLEAMVGDGSFREDLYYRLNVIRLQLPPLRARVPDILALARHFVRRFAYVTEVEVSELSDEAARALLAYPWPGNIRELENAMERAVAMTDTGLVELDGLPERIREFDRRNIVVAPDDPDALVTLRVLEERYVRRVLDVAGGNRSQAAAILGIDRKSLYRKLQRFGIDQGS